MAMKMQPTLRYGEDLALTTIYPRLRYMGSKYKVIPHLERVFSSLDFDTALDAFSGSGVVGFALKELGKQVTTNDFLNFPATIAKATVANPGKQLSANDLALLLSPNEDGRAFIQQTFEGLYFSLEDHKFLDAVWSHLHRLPDYKRELAIASLCLAAARKQPRGVFTITDVRYDDGRKNMHMSLKEGFFKAVADYNAVVFDNGRINSSQCADVFSVDPKSFDLVYLDPPYAPPKDDADYIKRYHFLEGLSVYWDGLEIMENTKTKKIVKRYTPFAYKNAIRDALRCLFDHFRNSIIVLSYSSNSVPDKDEIYGLLKEVKASVEIITIPHLYSFGTHSSAERRQAEEYIFVAR
ncbi:MAG: DNA adenine methylase [Chitinophagales bacterium]